MTMSSASSNVIITRYHSSYNSKTVFLQCHAFLCEGNTFIHIVFFNTFDKIGVFVRPINLFIHLASEFINASFGFLLEPAQTLLQSRMYIARIL